MPPTALEDPAHHAPRNFTKLAWPIAFVTVAAMGFGSVAFLAHEARAPKTEIRETPTLLTGLRDLARLETLSLRVEKVVDVKDHQSRLYGLVEASDALLFVASGEVILGVDLARLRDGDVRWDPATRKAFVELPAPEVLSTRFDEPHSYVHARTTDLLATRNEALESLARTEAAHAFEEAAKDPKVIQRAREQAERQVRSIARGFGAVDVVVAFRDGAGGELGMAAQ